MRPLKEMLAAFFSIILCILLMIVSIPYTIAQYTGVLMQLILESDED